MWNVLVVLLVAVSGLAESSNFNHPKRVRRFTQLEWEDCGNENASLHIHHMSITPMPIEVPGEVTVSLDAESTKEFAGANLDLIIQRQTWIGTITLPCLDHIGSCYYRDSCTLMDRMEEQNWGGIGTEIASQFKEMLHYDNQTVCPVMPYRMTVNDFTMEVPEMPSVLSFLAEGNYIFKGRLTEKNTQEELGCFSMKLSMQQKEEPCTGWLCRRRRRRRRRNAFFHSDQN